jgi:hypothetical protein
MNPNTQLSEAELRVLKTGTCVSTSGKSKLTYEVGCTPDSEIHLRITANTGSGAISQNWIPFKAIREALASVPPGELTSSHLHPLYAGKSVNTPAFLLAALMSEGLVRPSTSKRRCYECADDAQFSAAVDAWKTRGDEGVEVVRRKGGAKPKGASKKTQPVAAEIAVASEAMQGAASPEVEQDGPPIAIPSFTVIEPSPKAKKAPSRKAKAK